MSEQKERVNSYPELDEIWICGKAMKKETGSFCFHATQKKEPPQPPEDKTNA